MEYDHAFDDRDPLDDDEGDISRELKIFRDENADTHHLAGDDYREYLDLVGLLHSDSVNAQEELNQKLAIAKKKHPNVYRAFRNYQQKWLSLI